MATPSSGAGWGYGWDDPYAGHHPSGTGSVPMTDSMPATIAAETTRVEGFEWVVIPSLVLLVSYPSPSLSPSPSSYHNKPQRMGEGGRRRRIKIIIDRRVPRPCPYPCPRCIRLFKVPLLILHQALTIGGALMILVSMAWLEYRGRPATTRTRLVQALVVSDLILG